MDFPCSIDARTDSPFSVDEAVYFVKPDVDSCFDFLADDAFNLDQSVIHEVSDLDIGFGRNNSMLLPLNAHEASDSDFSEETVRCSAPSSSASPSEPTPVQAPTKKTKGKRKNSDKKPE
eukprot:3318765-Rhodomonas_salina.1